MPVVDAWDFPGSDGDYAYLPTLALTSGMRTGAGFPARTVIVVARIDTITPGADMAFFVGKRASNDGLNHGLVFDDGSDRLEYQFNATTQGGTSTSSLAASTWYALAYCDAGNAGNITIRVIPLSTATQSASASIASGGSNFDDAQTQEISLGGYESGGTVQQELNGQIALVLVVDGTALSQAQCEAFAADPLNYGDTLVQTYGANSWFWDDSGTDVGPNFVGAPTLAGTVARGSGNGPDITARSSPTAQPSVTSISNGGIIYSGEQRVTVTGANFGTTTGTLTLTTDANGTGGTAQDINSWSDTSISFNCSLGSVTPGQVYAFITNLTVGDNYGQIGSVVLDVRADPGPAVIALRQSPPSILMQSGQAINQNIGTYFYARHAQETATYSASGLPTGLSINTSTGVISGTTGSTETTYNVTVTLTDPNNDTAQQAFDWTIAAAPVVTTVPVRAGQARRATRRRF